jgi:hypothetical protein
MIQMAEGLEKVSMQCPRVKREIGVTMRWVKTDVLFQYIAGRRRSD